MKAQSAVEYFVVASMVLMFMVPIWAYMITTQASTSSELSLSYTRNAAKQIADAASLVNSQGNPAKINIKVYIPDGVINASINGKTLIFNVMHVGLETEVWYASQAYLQGADQIPTSEGYYYFDIISQDTYVEINRTV
jgi:hypothetical protein